MSRRVGMLILSVCCASGVLAQGSATPHRTVADTGRMAWGHADYTRYATADACDRAVMNVVKELSRAVVIDTVVYSPAGDTLPTVAKAVARGCGTRFTVENVSPVELWSVLRLSLALGNVAQARAAVERSLSLAENPGVRAEVFTHAIEQYLDAKPVRPDLVDELMPRLDSLGAGTLMQRFRAHVAFANYWHTMYDTARVRVESNAALALIPSISSDDRDLLVDALDPYVHLFRLADDAQDFVAQQKILDRGLAEVGNWRMGNGSRLFVQANRVLDLRRALYGKKTRPLKGAFSFNDGGAAYPRAGKATLLFYVNAGCGEIDCLSRYGMLRQLAAKYGRDLDIVLLTETHGYAPGTGPIPPEEEASAVSRYFLETLKIPAVVVVDRAIPKQELDGRISYTPSPIGAMFQGWEAVNAVVVNRTGAIQWLGYVNRASDTRMVQAAIGRAMGENGGK